MFPLYKITGEGVGTPLAKIVQLPQGNTFLYAKTFLLFNGNSTKKYTFSFIISTRRISYYNIVLSK